MQSVIPRAAPMIEGLMIGIVRITTTIIAPSFLTAALFKIVGDLIILLGPKYSRLKPATCKLHLALAELMSALTPTA